MYLIKENKVVKIVFCSSGLIYFVALHFSIYSFFCLVNVSICFLYFSASLHGSSFSSFSSFFSFSINIYILIIFKNYYIYIFIYKSILFDSVFINNDSFCNIFHNLLQVVMLFFDCATGHGIHYNLIVFYILFCCWVLTPWVLFDPFID